MIIPTIMDSFNSALNHTASHLSGYEVSKRDVTNAVVLGTIFATIGIMFLTVVGFTILWLRCYRLNLENNRIVIRSKMSIRDIELAYNDEPKPFQILPGSVVVVLGSIVLSSSRKPYLTKGDMFTVTKYENGLLDGVMLDNYLDVGLDDVQLRARELRSGEVLRNVPVECVALESTIVPCDLL